MLGRNYSETFLDIFTNFGIDIKHHQTKCNVLILRTINPPTVCMELCPFIVFSTLQRRYNAGDGSHKIEPRYK